MIWFTSDTHFGHANIIGLCSRPFSTIGEMNEALPGIQGLRIPKEQFVQWLKSATVRRARSGRQAS